MEAFESVVKTLLEHDGYWVMTGYKVNLTKEEKVKIGRPSSPRWEIDILAYRGSINTAYAIECKSYLDSGGVEFGSMQKGSKSAKRYKLFNEDVLRSTVLNRIAIQLSESGMAAPDVRVQLGLAAGNLYGAMDEEKIATWFEEMGWIFYSPNRIVSEITKLSRTSYFNDVGVVVAKLIQRNPVCKID